MSPFFNNNYKPCIKWSKYTSEEITSALEQIQIKVGAKNMKEFSAKIFGTESKKTHLMRCINGSARLDEDETQMLCEKLGMKNVDQLMSKYCTVRWDIRPELGGYGGKIVNRVESPEYWGFADKTYVADVIISKMKLFNYTEKSLAETCNVTISAVRHWTTAKRYPSFSNRKSLAMAFDTTGPALAQEAIDMHVANRGITGTTSVIGE